MTREHDVAASDPLSRMGEGGGEGDRTPLNRRSLRLHCLIPLTRLCTQSHLERRRIGVAVGIGIGIEADEVRFGPEQSIPMPIAIPTPRGETRAGIETAVFVQSRLSLSLSDQKKG